MKISHLSWLNTLIRITFLKIRMTFLNSSTPSVFMRFFRSLSNSGDLTQQRRLNLKKHRPTDRPMTTPLFLLRCVQPGISLSELDMLTIGIVNDMFSERERDEYEWVEFATDSDMAAF